jgi:hypothetical protein
MNCLNRILISAYGSWFTVRHKNHVAPFHITLSK